MSTSDYANIVVAVTSISALFIAVYTYVQQNRQARRLLGIQILREFEDQFFRSIPMRRIRHNVCKHYAENGLDADASAEGWRLADEFGSICYYINHGYVDIDAAWTVLYYWIDKYWFLLDRYAHGVQMDPDGTDYLHNFRECHEKLTQFGERQRHLAPPEKRHDKKAIEKFLNDEIQETSDLCQ